MMVNNNLKYVDFGTYKNGSKWYYLVAYNKYYGFDLVIYDCDSDMDEPVFKKFLRTQDISYCGNYLRKVARNNYGAAERA